MMSGRAVGHPLILYLLIGIGSGVLINLLRRNLRVLLLATIAALDEDDGQHDSGKDDDGGNTANAEHAQQFYFSFC